MPALYESFFAKPDVLSLIQTLFKNTCFISNGFLYGVWNKHSGILGFTPEFLFSLEGNKFRTMALAGTGPQTGPSLLKDQKELKEHQLVVQSLQDSLRGILKWDKTTPSEMIFPPLKHLLTKLTGSFTSKVSFEKICHTLHPTAALGGYPKKQALNWLKKQISQKNRKYFGAPLAFFETENRYFCLIALRALEWNGEEIKCFSGGGLIKESVLQKEWRELSLKRQQVISFFS